jgi:DNA-binding transcriptional LysR family regulator
MVAHLSALTAFDELRQGVKNIEFLADPTIGEIRIGGNDAIIAGLLPTVFTRLRSDYPGIAIHVMQLAAVQQQYRELRERRIDLVLGRIAQPIEEDRNLVLRAQLCRGWTEESMASPPQN